MKTSPSLEIDESETYAELVNGLSAQPERIAISWFDRGGKAYHRTRGELQREVLRLSSSLQSLPINGMHIALVGENCYAWIVTFLAITALGGIVVCIDTEQADETIRGLILQADSRMIFCSAEYEATCAPLVSSGAVEKLFLLSEPAEGEAEPFTLPTLSPDQYATIIFTSGTTKRAKPVLLSHRNLLKNAYAGAKVMNIKEDIFSALPFYHSYGLNCAVTVALLSRTRLIISGDVRLMLRDLQFSAAEIMIAVPLMANVVYNTLQAALEKSACSKSAYRMHKRKSWLKNLPFLGWRKEFIAVKERCFGPLCILITGGAHLDREVAEGLEDFGILTLPGYGATECSPLITVNQIGAHRMDSVGKVLPGCEVKIVDGEIVVRGDHVAAGYYQEPEQTAESFRDGWYYTGDLGHFDKDGYLYITGRCKNLIVFNNGKKMSPELLEDLVIKIPLVQEVMAYGATFGTSVDDVRPAISVYPNQELAASMTAYEVLETLQAEINKINARLPLYQQIQMINIRDKEFAKTALNKIIRDLA